MATLGTRKRNGIRERAQRHGIALGLEVDERLAELSADERKFKQSC